VNCTISFIGSFFFVRRSNDWTKSSLAVHLSWSESVLKTRAFLLMIGNKVLLARLDLTALASAFRRRGCSSSMIPPRQERVDDQDIACARRDARIVDRLSNRKVARSSRILYRKWTGCCNGRGHSWTVHAHAICRYVLSLIDRTAARVTIAERRWLDASHVALVKRDRELSVVLRSHD